jgi:probable phosphoglycerate mutase
MSTLLLLRHGEVLGILPPTFRGRTELELTERGRAQAERTAQRVRAGWPQVAAIYCSPRNRTVETAKAVGREYSLTPQPMPDFDDLDYGTWQGVSHADAAKRWPDQWATWNAAPETVQFPQGESLPDLSARVARGLRQVLPRPDAAIVVVAHDSTNRVLLMQILGMPLRFYRTLAQDPCCLNVIDSPGPAAQLRLMNATDHLHGL